jgi:OCT family organic cation transporter-like MFS transporter 18
MPPQTEVIVTYANIILYSVSYQLQRPVEPFLVRSLIHNHTSISNNITDNIEEEQTSNRTYGRLTSFFSFIQTIGSPLVGILLDRIGVRRTSILVYLASAASYWILANATSPAWLFWSKVPTILQHAFLVGQATVASYHSTAPSSGNSVSEVQNNDDKTRAVALGRMTTAYTVGATLGPALGGFLAIEGDYYASARLAVCGSIVSVFLSIACLKDRVNNHHHHEGHVEADKRSGSSQKIHQKSFTKSIHNTFSYLSHPKLGPLLFLKLLNGVSSSAFTTVLPLLLMNKLHLDTSQLGLFMSASSLSVAIFASVGIAPFMSFVGNRSERLAILGMAGRIVSVMCFGGIVSWSLLDLKENSSKEWLWLATAVSTVISISSHMHATSVTTLTTGAVTVNERGAILGLEHGLFSLARVIGPTIGTFLLGSRKLFMSESSSDGIWGVISACVIMDLILLLLCSRYWSSNQTTQIEK